MQAMPNAKSPYSASDWNKWWARCIAEQGEARRAREEAERAERERDMAYLASQNPDLFPGNCTRAAATTNDAEMPNVNPPQKAVFTSSDGVEFG